MTGDVEEANGVVRMMLLDASFTDAPASAHATAPSVLLYGLTLEGESIAVHVNDFLPYFWFPAPAYTDEGKDVLIKDNSLALVKEHLMKHMQASRKKSGDSSDPFIAGISVAYRTPLMYYRLGGPFPFLKVEVWRGKDVAAVAKDLTMLAEKNDLRSHGLVWRDQTCHEEGIKLGMRFFCDTAMAGGSWVEIKQAECVPHSQQKSRCSKEIVAGWRNLTGLTPDVTHHMEFTEALHSTPAAPHKSSSMTLEESKEIILDLEDQSDASLDDDENHQHFQSRLGATEEQPETGKRPYSATATSEEAPSSSVDATWNLICPLRMLSLHVQCAGGGRILSSGTNAGSGADKLMSPGRGRGRGRAGRVVSPSSKGMTSGGTLLGFSETAEAKVSDIENTKNFVGGGSAVPSRDPVLVISHILCFRGRQDGTRQVVFTYGKNIEGKLPGVEVRGFDTEAAMLMAWQEFFFWEVDPDVVCVFQMKDSLRYIAERFKVLKLGAFDIGRRKGQTSEVKSVVTYGKHWVRQQARMTSTSNQEVFRAYVEGRLVIDMLRVILVSFNLSTFTLGECSQLFLGTPKEVLSTLAVAELWGGKHGGLQRLLLYSLHEAEVALKLMERLQTVPETVEMARVTGLTLADVLYKAQMVRIQSLLLRSARREGWLLGGATLNGQLSESPFLLHPKENRTAGFYKDPVAILDFASLYPSLFMAHNLCYTTLVHPGDADSLSANQLMTSPTGAQFVVSTVRRGVLPRICGALITARKQARDRMAADAVSSEERAVLDGRQKALKLCSNALYGFTGASASPQQALPLADTCLRCFLKFDSLSSIFASFPSSVKWKVLVKMMIKLIFITYSVELTINESGVLLLTFGFFPGMIFEIVLVLAFQVTIRIINGALSVLISMGAASCKQAVELVGSTFQTAQVIYAQTDSVFIRFHGASIDEAIQLGSQAADIVSQAFPSPMVLKFERVLCPFLLLQVNRYAGKQYTSNEASKGQGTLYVKGIEAERRDVPGFVRHICKRALCDILVENDVAGALDSCKNSIRRLMAGKWSFSDLVMTGGLWRVDDHDIARLAAVSKSPQKQSGASTAEEGRGPHVALSVRLKRKDPDRQFHIGERIPYILMANSSKLQDNMAEDPIDALLGGIPVNTHVYLENKLRKPLESILEHVIDSATLRDLFTGSHTIPPPSASLGALNRTQALVSNFFRPKNLCLFCRKPLEDDNSALCQDCALKGCAQIAAINIFLEVSEYEKKLGAAQAECMSCHSGGRFQSVRCTNSDCPAFYMRYECYQKLTQVESSLVKLDRQF